MPHQHIAGREHRLLNPGTKLGHYAVVSQLGAGGMGEVYRARDEKLERDVALKLLPAETFRDAQARARLLQEARSAAALNHPHICTIHEVGESGGQAYIAMEFVEGRPLSERLQGGALPAGDVLRFGAQIADALSHAHDRRIIHRDLKAANVVISGGHAKVLDFGLAKRLRDDELEDVTRSQASLTKPGAVVGTLAYMAPEQLRGQPDDARSDIWSLGVMLYEMAAGARPFQAQTGFALSSAILNESPPPLSAKFPVALRAVIERCLQKDPARRYQRASEVRAALEAIHIGASAPWTALRYSIARHGGWIAAITAVVLLATAVGVWQPWRSQQSTEPLQAVPLTTQPGVHRYPSLSPDGNHVVFTWTGPKQDNPDIYLQQIGAGSPLRLTSDPSNDYNPVWSPDGRAIAFLRLQSEGRSELRLIPPLGGPERKLAEIRVREVFVTAPYLAWCPDSDCLVVTDSPGQGKPVALFAISLESGDKRQLTYPQPPLAGDANPAVSPDGSSLVFRRNANNLFTGELYLLPLRSGMIPDGEPRRLTKVDLDAEHPTWLDDQEIIFSARGYLWRLPVSGENQPARLPFVGEDGLMPEVSRPQPGRPRRLAYVRSFNDGNIWRLETSAAGTPASSRPVLAIASTRADDMPDLSPDGRRVAFTSDRSGGWEIWLSDPDGSNAVQLTSIGGRVTGYPQWSPDGKWVAFHSNLAGQSDVYVVSAAGGKPLNLSAHSALDAFPSFSHDGKWIYFSSNRSGADRIWKVSPSGGNLVQVTNDLGYAPRESPDGAYLYYVQDIFTPSALWCVPINGGAPVKVLDGVILGNFAVLERGVYYIDRPSGPAAIYLIDMPSGETRLQYFDFATRKSVTVAGNLGTVDLPFTVSPDGRTIFYPRIDSSTNNLMLVENFR